MRVRLDDVCEKASSNLKQSDVIGKTGDYPVYGAAGYIGNIDFYHQDIPYIAVVKDGAGIGRTMLLPAKSSVIGTMQYLLPKENVLPEYLSYAVQYMHLEKYFSGATIPHIYFRDYKNEEFSLATIEKQKEIINILNKTKNAINTRRQELQKLDELIKARFIEMFEGKYDELIIGETFKTTSGGTPSKKHPEYYIDGNINWLTSGEVNNGIVTSVKQRITEDAVSNSSAKMIPIDSILIAMYGATAGQVGLLKVKTTTNQAVCSVLPKEGYSPEYLYYAISSKKKWMISQCAGGAQPNISQTIIRRMKIIDAPFDKQKEFASLFKQVDKSKFAIRRSLKILADYDII